MWTAFLSTVFSILDGKRRLGDLRVSFLFIAPACTDRATTRVTEVFNVVHRDLEIAEERLDYYSQVLNDKARQGKLDKEKSKRLFTKLDQWFETLDKCWDTLNAHY
jgi:hypothetical protein